MRRIFLIVVLTCAWISIGSAQAQICKWVDENGITHYETECPDDGDAEVLEIDTKLLEEPVDEAPQDAEQVQDDFAPLQPGENAQAEISLAPPPPSILQDAEALASCVRAVTNLVILQVEAPVFYDDQGALQHGWSDPARAYQGPRTYLDDQEREAEIRQYENYLAENCGESQAEREGIAELVAEQNLPGIRNEICAEKVHLLDRLQGGVTGLPSATVRELQIYIAENCR